MQLFFSIVYRIDKCFKFQNFVFRFPVHRTIMAASSTYFQALLGPHYKEANQKEIVLNEVSGPTLKTLIHYCYTGYIKITHDNVESIMDAAASREMTPLAEKCTHFWSENIGINRCLKILLVADKYQLTDLWQKSLRYICENFEDIPIGEMVKVDGKNFGAILKQRQITAAESIIFERFVEWIQYDVANRATFVASYANLIRLCHFAGKVKWIMLGECVALMIFIFRISPDFSF